MRQIRIGDVAIDAVIERKGPWRRPQDFLPAHDEATFHQHFALDGAGGFRRGARHDVITCQTFVMRTPRHTILVDTRT